MYANHQYQNLDLGVVRVIWLLELPVLGMRNNRCFNAPGPVRVYFWTQQRPAALPPQISGVVTQKV